MAAAGDDRFQTCYTRVYDIVRTIPRGRVMTYGQIAELVGDACSARIPAIQVGYALAASGRYAPDIPWWRVIGRAGEYGILRKAALSARQRALLAEEGVIADDDGRYHLASYLYHPDE